MPKIVIGDSEDESQLKLIVKLNQLSQLELHVGKGRHMSTREIEVIERESSKIDYEMLKLKEAIGKLQDKSGSDKNCERLIHEAEVLADTGSKVVREKKWYDLTTKGLVEAAKATGEIAGPVVSSAMTILKLLKSASI